VEIVMAVGIFGGSVIGLAEFGRRFANANGLADVRAQASDYASSRVERVKSERTYASIDTCATTTQTIAGTRYTIHTQIARTNNAASDYKVVTVTITHPQLPVPVTKTTAIAAF
jgi:hypothetical protein